MEKAKTIIASGKFDIELFGYRRAAVKRYAQQLEQMLAEKEERVSALEKDLLVKECALENALMQNAVLKDINRSLLTRRNSTQDETKICADSEDK